MRRTNDLHIAFSRPLVSPAQLKAEFPMSEASNDTVYESREAITAIIRKEDPRLLAIIGPCSIHDPKAAMEYAGRLNDLRKRVEDRILIVMRVYFEKPRTTIGWRGFLTDPHLDGIYDIAYGLRAARKLTLDITAMGLPVGSEVLDPIVPQYISDLISWASIGARTTESQTHRELASGLSMPVGFKNGTDGSYEAAANALKSTHHPHSFIGIDQDGRTCILNTTGNPVAHVISRGGRDGPNYDPENIGRAEQFIKAIGIDPAILLDCSHANSGKRYELQFRVLRSMIEQRRGGTDSIIGFMLESNLFEGNQRIPVNLADLRYGVSITDECVGWDATAEMVDEVYRSVDFAGGAG